MYLGPGVRNEQLPQLSGFVPNIGEAGSGNDVSSVIGTLLRRKRVFLAILVGFLALVVLFTALVPRSYTATTKLIAGAANTSGGQTGDSTLPLLNALLSAGSLQSPETYVDLIQQTPVAQEVSRNLRLNVGPGALLDRLSVKPVTNTAIIDLSASWSDPEIAARIANEFARVFVNRERDLVAGQAGSALDYLSQQMPTAEASMHKADNALAQFQSSHPTVYAGAAVTGDTTGNGTSIAAVQQKFAQLTVDREQAQAQLANVQSQLASVGSTINGSSNINQNPVVSQLETQLAQVNVQLEAARKQFTEQHPTVVGLEEQKAQLEREIRNQPATVVAGNNIVPNPVFQQLNQQAASLRSQIAGDAAQLSSLGAQMGASAGSTNNLPREQIQLADLQRSARMAEDVYTALRNKYNQATVAKTAALSNVAITQPATAAETSVKPNWKLNLLLGLALGLVLGVSGVFIVEFFDNTFKDEQDVQRSLPIPLLTTVPQLNAHSPEKLPWLRALTVESFMQLVTALRYSSDKPLRTLAITSPNQGDGKSTIALSTAIAMAEMEPRVVLIDGDMRKPTLHTRLGLENSVGLSDFIVGAQTVESITQKTKYEGLDLISSGAHVPNPIKLVHSTRFDELLQELLTTYRVVVLDTPALLPVFDGAVIASKSDGTVLVVSAGTTDMPSTKKALQRLSGLPNINMLGVVLNRVEPSNGYKSYYLNGDSPAALPHEHESVV